MPTNGTQENRMKHEPTQEMIDAARDQSARDRGLHMLSMARAHILSGDKSKDAIDGYEHLFDALDYKDRDHQILAILLLAAEGQDVHQRAKSLLDAMTDHIGQRLADKANDAYQLACERLEGEL